jgi:hypothetical protein
MNQANPRFNYAIMNHQPQSWINKLHQRLNELITDKMLQSWMCVSNRPIQPPHQFTFVNSHIQTIFTHPNWNRAIEPTTSRQINLHLANQHRAI